MWVNFDVESEFVVERPQFLHLHPKKYQKKVLRLNRRNFDVNYLNPIIFFRPIEYNIGSSDNSFFGVNLKATIFKRHILYSQLILDEFLLEEIRNNNGWWANKYGFQFGYKSFDLFELNGLGFQLEFNSVRPFTYSHLSSLQNYGNANHSLAHPLESNFRELLTS